MKIDRLIGIIFTLLNCDKISAKKLSEKFNVSERTIYRDVETISLCGIPIFTIQGINGGIGILPEYKIDKNFLSASEIEKILLGLNSVSNLSEVDTLKEKIFNLSKKSNMNYDKISVDLTPWMGNKELINKFQIIKNAIENNNYINFKYYDKYSNKSDRNIEPYQLVLKQNSWYLIGYCKTKLDFRTFKIARIVNLVKQSSEFIKRDFIDKTLNTDNWINDKIINIELILDISMEGIITEYGGYDDIKYYDENNILTNIPFTDDEYGYNILLSFGNKLKYIINDQIREKYNGKLKTMLSQQINFQK